MMKSSSQGMLGSKEAWMSPRTQPIVIDLLRSPQILRKSLSNVNLQQYGAIPEEVSDDIYDSGIRYTVTKNSDDELPDDDDVFANDLDLNQRSTYVTLPKLSGANQTSIKIRRTKQVNSALSKKLPKLCSVLANSLVSHRTMNASLQQNKRRSRLEATNDQKRGHVDKSAVTGDQQRYTYLDSSKSDVEFFAIRAQGQENARQRIMRTMSLNELSGVSYDIRKRLSLDVTREFPLNAGIPVADEVFLRKVSEPTINSKHLLYFRDVDPNEASTMGYPSTSVSSDTSNDGLFFTIDSKQNISTSQADINKIAKESDARTLNTLGPHQQRQLEFRDTVNNDLKSLIAGDENTINEIEQQANLQRTDSEEIQWKKSLLKEPRIKRFRPSLKTVQFGPKVVREVTKIEYA